MNQTPNNSIKCSVTNCAHHCGGQNYCTLNEIKVGCCEPNATKCASTECASFQLGFFVFGITPWARRAPRPWDPPPWGRRQRQEQPSEPRASPRAPCRPR